MAASISTYLVEESLMLQISVMVSTRVFETLSKGSNPLFGMVPVA